MENTEIWLADARNKVTFMFACLHFAMIIVSIAAVLPIAVELNKRKQMQSLKT